MDEAELIRRLARIEGQVRGVSAMVEQDRRCIDVLTQISAIHAALDEVALGLIDGHARKCMLEERGDREERVNELMATLGRLLK